MLYYDRFRNCRSIVLGGGTAVDELAPQIRSQRLSRPFRYMAPVRGGNSSMRLIASYPGAHLVELPLPLDADALAQELVKLASTARYAADPRDGSRKGWKLRLVPYEDHLAVLAEATWFASTLEGGEVANEK